MTTPLFGHTLLDALQSDKSTLVNEFMRMQEAIAAGRIIDRDLTAPPGSPNDGDIHIIGGTPTGGWASFSSGDMVMYRGTTWVEISLYEGMAFRLADEDVTIQYNGTAWDTLDGYQTLTDAANIDCNFNLGITGEVTLAGNRTMNAPTNGIAGRDYTFRIVQDATGSRTLSWNSVFRWPGAVVPILSTAANAVDLFRFITPDGTNYELIASELDVR